jgi:hypothetical protein
MVSEANRNEQIIFGLAMSGVVLGSRLLHADRAATLLSGSPPGDRRWSRPGLFAGAACCTPIDLPPCKAAPLQGTRWAIIM